MFIWYWDCSPTVRWPSRSSYCCVRFYAARLPRRERPRQCLPGGREFALFNDTITSYLLRIMLQRSPLLLVVLGGVVFAIVRWRRHPRISFLTLLGLMLYLLKVFIFAGLSYSIPQVRESLHWSYAIANNLYLALNVLSDLAFSGIRILLVAAAFAQRRQAPAINT